ncbi:MAG: L17 family ribosomal protein, partial [Deltaproteobacteria bacterium]|nr:L17 family ribosomal protein [Deltaproteobacteria bacterium]
THRLFEELKDRYLNRQGGYVRIIKKGNRKGDGAPLSVIQLLPEDKGKQKSKTITSKDASQSKKKKET